MPRPRYPSDEARKKQRPHAKVHLSIRSHPRFGEALEDPETRGIVVGLWVLAVQYHASQNGDEVTLGLGDLVWLTGRAQRAHALGALRAVCGRMEYVMREEGRRVVVHIRNLQRKQGFNYATRVDTPRNSAPSEEPKNQGTEEPKNRSAPRNSRRSRKPLTDPPEELSPEDYDRVRRHFELVSPGCVALDLDARIECALRYYRREGRRTADWAATVIDNITSLENHARERHGESKLRSVREAREILRARAGNGGATPEGVKA